MTLNHGKVQTPVLWVVSFWICRCSWLESQTAPFWQVGLGKKGPGDAVGEEEGLDDGGCGDILFVI